MTEFDDALALETVDESLSTGRLDDRWAIGGAVNGGLLMALTATALGERLARAGGPAARHDAPIAFSAYFLSASTEGPVEVRTEVVRVGRAMSTGQARLLQTGPNGPVERLRMLASFGDLRASAEPVLRSPEPPDLPAPDECVDASASPADFRDGVPMLGRIDLRLDPATAGWTLGQPSEKGRMRGWIRFADGRPVDAVSLVFFLDALPPVAFDLGIMGWAPTLELTGHLRGEPADGWLRVELSTRTVTGGLLEEDAMIWDRTGRMVAQSRQLAGIRVPGASGGSTA